MPAHSRPKDGVLSHAYVARIQVLPNGELSSSRHSTFAIAA